MKMRAKMLEYMRVPTQKGKYMSLVFGTKYFKRVDINYMYVRLNR
jgi:hypothetical protein